MRHIKTALLGLFAATLLGGCEANEKPVIALTPTPTARVQPQTTDFGAFVVGLVATKTLENNQPETLDARLFNNTLDPHAFDEVFAE